MSKKFSNLTEKKVYTAFDFFNESSIKVLDIKWLIYYQGGDPKLLYRINQLQTLVPVYINYHIDRDDNGVVYKSDENNSPEVGRYALKHHIYLDNLTHQDKVQLDDKGKKLYNWILDNLPKEDYEL